MSESVLARYGPVTVYMEPGHPSPMYHYDGQAVDNPYGELAILLEDDQLEEVMYNGGAQCVKVAHRDFGICRICFRVLASNAQLPGVRKSSW